MANENTSDDVIDQDVSQSTLPQKETTDSSVTAEQTDAQKSEETQQSTLSEGESEVQGEVDERGVDYKNVAAEERRKRENLESQFQNFQSQLPQLIEQSVQQANAKVQEKPQYTIAQLESFAQESPEHRPWVEEQKAKIIEQNVIAANEKRFQEAEQSRRNEIVKQQAEQWV